MTARSMVLFAAMCVIWGIPYLMIRVAVREVSPATLVFVRTAGAAVLLVPIALLRHELVPALRRPLPLVAFAVVEIAVPWLLLSSAERRISSSLAGLLIAAVPLVGAVIARTTGRRERLGGTSVAGLLVGLVGVSALVGLDVSGVDATALVEVAVVVLGYAFGPAILANRLQDAPGLGVIAASLALSALVYAPIAAFSFPAAIPAPRVLGAIATLAIVCTALAFVLFFELIAEIGPVRATVITYVNPAVAVALGVGIEGERFSTGMGIGFTLILLGSALATRSGRFPRTRPTLAAEDGL